MVKITKVYTRTGDAGETQLAAGVAIKKSSNRVGAIGAIDELNAVLGWSLESVRPFKQLKQLLAQGERIQNELFNLGAQLSVLPEDRRADTPVIQQQNIAALEIEIDEANENLPKLTSFILPGGGETSSRFHITRGVCRRAERDLLRLSEHEQLESVMLAYLNRLSDWLFVMARYSAKVLEQQETLWQPHSS